MRVGKMGTEEGAVVVEVESPFRLRCLSAMVQLRATGATGATQVG